MREIIGNTTATPNPRPDWNQTDESKADYIKNKPIILTEEDVSQIIDDHTVDINVQPDWNQTDPTQPDYIKNKPNSIGGANTNITVSGDILVVETIGGQSATINGETLVLS